MMKRSDTGECHADASFEKRAPETATAGGAGPGDSGADGVPSAAAGEPAGLAALLNALTAAAETGRGYLGARAAVVRYVSAVRASAFAARAVSFQADRHALVTAGAMLANCAFNLAQCERLTESERRSLDESRKAWDVVCAALGEPTWPYRS